MNVEHYDRMNRRRVKGSSRAKEIMIRTYRAAREAYKPERVRVLLIAESPPASGGYFYFEKTMGKDHLFRETMKAVGLWPEDRRMPKGVDKRGLLTGFQAKGLFLIDTSLVPVDKLPRGERRRAIVRDASRLVDDVRRLDPEGIVIVKASIYGPVRDALELSGFGERVLNLEALPFPSHGNQRTYRDKLRSLIASNGP